MMPCVPCLILSAQLGRICGPSKGFDLAALRDESSEEEGVGEKEGRQRQRLKYYYLQGAILAGE